MYREQAGHILYLCSMLKHTRHESTPAVLSVWQHVHRDRGGGTYGLRPHTPDLHNLLVSVDNSLIKSLFFFFF